MTTPLIKPYTDQPLRRPIPGFPDWKKLLLPMLRIRCFGPAGRFEFKGVVDSGSPFCLFKTEIADSLNINIRGPNGKKGEIGGIIGGPLVDIYYHKITIQIEGTWSFEVVGGFIEDLDTSIILGRNGFFDRFIVTFNHSTTPPEFEITKIEGPKQRIGFP